jgi:hypothetical protein
MKLRSGLVFVGLLSLGLLNYSCANGDTVSGSTGGGQGGSSSTGTGGNGSGTGGNSSGTGGTHTGGSTGAGGTHTGGNTGTGGILTGTGGTHTGGSTGTGGISPGTGGVSPGTGGTSTGTGGTGVTTCGTSFDVTAAGFVTMPAVGGGCWSGFASDGGDAGSTISPGAFSSCGMPCMLTMTGTLNASNAANSYAGYSYLGFNVGQDSSGSTPVTVVPKGTSLTVTYTNTSASTVRVALNADATGTTSWCYTATSSPVTIPYTSFTEQCYDTTPGTAYAKQGIISVQLSVPGAATSGPVNVTLVSVVEK